MSDIGWFTPGGTEMSEDDWRAGFARSLGVFLNGSAIPTPNERGERILDDTFYAMFNASHEAAMFTLPDSRWGQKWALLLETDEQRDAMDEESSGEVLHARGQVPIQGRALALLRRVD